MDPTTVSQRRWGTLPWVRLLAEMVAIITSILLAFSLDAWWEGRREARDEIRLLQALESEFLAARPSLEDQAAAHLVRAQHAQAILDRLWAAQSGDNVSMPSEYIVQILRFNTYDPESGTLDGAISSGRLALIRDDDLRAAIAGWPARRRDAREEQELTRDFIYQVFIPGLSSSTDLSRFVAVPSQDLDVTSLPEAVQLPNTIPVRMLVAERRRLARASQTDLANLLVNLDETLERIRQAMVE